MPTPARVQTAAEADGEATLAEFVCRCGHTLVAADAPDVTVFAGVDTLVCDTCDREWTPSWHGMRFCTPDDETERDEQESEWNPSARDESIPRSVRSSYFRQHRH